MHNHSTTRYTCRYCNSPMGESRTPAGEPCYECTNRACQFVAMAGCECSMNVAPVAAEPTPIAARTAAERAADKAAYYLATGLQIVETRGAYLVPSGTRSNIIHRVQNGVCSCEAGQNGRSCWHVAAVDLVMTEQLAA